MAEAVFKKMIVEEELDSKVKVDSAGLGNWHAGEKPHKGTQKILDTYKVPHDWIRSRQITSKDFKEFDFIVAMDEDNVSGLSKFGAVDKKQVFRLLDLVEKSKVKNVPDPYYTDGFEEVYDLVFEGCRILLDVVKAKLEESKI